MKKELASALNDQMVFELYSSYIYLGLAACLEKMKLPGAAHWMRIQVDEEIIHAGIFYNYLNDQSEDIVLDTIKKPEVGKIKTPLDAFKEALKHEKLVTARINKLVELSIKSGGYATMAFLNFFVTEQVQEFGASEVHPFKSIPDGSAICGLERRGNLAGRNFAFIRIVNAVVRSVGNFHFTSLSSVVPFLFLLTIIMEKQGVENSISGHLLSFLVFFLFFCLPFSRGTLY